MVSELEGWVYVVGACVVLFGRRYLLRLRDRSYDDPLADAIDEASEDASTRDTVGNDGESVVDVLGGQTTAESDMTMTTADGRTFTGTELQTVEDAREHALAHPEASSEELVAAADPVNSVTPDGVDAHWRDVLRPGLAALTDVDVDRIDGNDGSDVTVEPETDAIDRDDDVSTTDAPATDDEAGEARDDDVPRATARVDESAAQTTSSALDGGTLAPGPDADNDRRGNASAGGDDATDLGVGVLAPGSRFHVKWVARDDEHARVTDGEHVATFALVDRDGDLAVRPLDSKYRTDDDVPSRWYVDAAAALEDALPDAYDDRDAPESAWPNASDSD
ncbi:hypothetical protein [Halorubellus sp. PRR65]|uniref:hypothetical protein n=1 Tax=Halorubellus sp. PRR65 TaxID=3098148 RepID=UPI002B25E9AA|nr:hypothetical protein [Halorubellus sp. PRR65]